MTSYFLVSDGYQSSLRYQCLEARLKSIFFIVQSSPYRQILKSFSSQMLKLSNENFFSNTLTTFLFFSKMSSVVPALVRVPALGHLPDSYLNIRIIFGTTHVAQNIAEWCRKYCQYFIAIEILSLYFCQILQNILSQHYNFYLLKKKNFQPLEIL